MNPNNSRPILFLGILLLSLWLPNALSAMERSEQDILPGCIKCHFDIVQIVKRLGHAHRDKVACTDCHLEHPPNGKNIIPLCTRCHEGEDHFSLKDCLICHNPHKPLDIVLPNRITDPCLTCHEGQGRQLVDFPSIHSRLGCTACHKQHGWIPSCFRCHKPHVASQTSVEACAKCHSAHKPLEVTYDDATPSELCADCHGSQMATLRASSAKHQSFSCVKCHPAKHRTIPACADCHGKPHSDFILQKVAKCGDCHGIAHDIIN